MMFKPLFKFIWKYCEPICYALAPLFVIYAAFTTNWRWLIVALAVVFWGFLSSLLTPQKGGR